MPESSNVDTGEVQRTSQIAFCSQLIDAANAEGVPLRALGGIAVALRCPSAEPPGPFARAFSDIDLVTSRGSARRLTKLLRESGCVPNDRFNAANGESRLLFYFGDEKHLDVFVDRFQLCHELPLGKRLDLHNTTISLADLLLSKLQVAKLNHKDVTDVAALLLDHPLTPDESGINVDYLTGLLASDWGWWRTSTETLGRLDDHVNALSAEPPAKRRLKEQLAALAERIEERPKSLKWKARARVGDRRPWRIDPDDIAP